MQKSRTFKWKDIYKSFYSNECYFKENYYFYILLFFNIYILFH